MVPGKVERLKGGAFAYELAYTDDEVVIDQVRRPPGGGYLLVLPTVLDEQEQFPR